MKYIKTFEDKVRTKFRFKCDDIVYHEKQLYQIGNSSPGWDNINKYELLRIKKINPIKLDSLQSQYWVEEQYLKKIEPEELELLFMAGKYNL